MINPFKKTVNNANKTKKVYGDEHETSKTETRKCKNCGAVRPADSNLTTCDYCGYKFMNIDEEIKVKNRVDNDNK